MGRAAQSMEYAPVGQVLNNGYDAGGSRIYPFSRGLAIQPNAQYSSYIGSASGLPIVPPVNALPATGGIAGNTATSQAVSEPFGRYSPVPWVLGALVVVTLVMYHLHYGNRKGKAA
jgi:hypothetical protein